MRQTYKMIPIYTADVSGVCSALYELGGMTVMHDPSGCNSTYNTHDEIRWGFIIAQPASARKFQTPKHWLSPIPLQQVQLSKGTLEQNPGW